jgi:hypothetical protein
LSVFDADTKDLDIRIDRSDANAQAPFKALARFGAPLKSLQPSDFTERRSFTGSAWNRSASIS